MQQSNLDHVLDKFVGVTAKSKVAIVIPLYGYWNSLASGQLNAETLKITLDRIYSGVHQMYFLFVGDPGRTPKEIGDIILGKSAGGNAKGIAMKREHTYGDYLRAGVKSALEETDSQFIVVVNPWLIVQHNALDILVDRVNRDDVKIVCGFDLRGVIDPEQFNNYSNTTPAELKALDLNYMGMKRYAAEIATIDTKYKTHYFIARDMWQTMYSNGHEIVTSQRIPIFTFDVDWTELDSETDFEADRQYFISKWRFDPGIVYGK